MDRNVYELLLHTLAADPNTRLQAELNLKQLANEPEYPVSLARCAVAPECTLPQRQAAIFALRNYIQHHWSPLAEHFKLPEVTAEAKRQVHNLIVHGLGDAESKVRVGVAYVMAGMAQYDWPEAWPELFDYLLHLLKTGSVHQVQASMHVYTEFFQHDMSDDQLELVTQLLPELFRIYADNATYDWDTRARAVAVFKSCMEMLAMVCFNRPELASRYVKPVLEQWVNRFLTDLDTPSRYRIESTSDPTCNVALKVEMLRAFKVILRFFPKASPVPPRAMALVVQDLARLTEPFTQGYVYSQEAQTWDTVLPSQTDHDATGISLDAYLLACFDFLYEGVAHCPTRVFTTQLEGGRKIDPSVFHQELLTVLVPFLQIAYEQLENWSDDINEFVADAEAVSLNFSVRTSAQDVIRALLDKVPTATITGLGNVAPIFEAQSTRARQAGDTRWWIILEACLVAIGLASTEVVDICHAQSKPLNFDLAGLFQHVVIEMARCSEPFARGRALVFTSQFAEILPTSVTLEFIRAAVAALDSSTAALSVKMCALKALGNFFRTSSNDSHLDPFIVLTLQGVVALEGQYSEDTLMMGLDTLYVTLKLRPDLSAQCEPLVGPFVLGVWQRYPANHLVNSITVDLLTVLAENHQCFKQFQNRVIPLLTGIIRSTDADQGVVANAVDLLSGFIRGGPSPLPVGYVNEVFPALVQLLSRTEDSAILQNGQECFKHLVSKDLDHLIQWRDERGRSGLDILLEFIEYLLQPDQSESTAFFVGDLLVKLVQKGYNQLIPIIPHMVQTVLNKVGGSKSSVFVQSLLQVLIHLILADVNRFIDIIRPIMVGDQLGFNLLVTQWCEEYESFSGMYELKCSTVAMTKLWQHAGPLLDQVQVQEPASTRNNNGPTQVQTIPATVKIFKLLLSDVQNDLEYKTAEVTRAERLARQEDSDEDGEWEDINDDTDIEGLLAPAEIYKDLLEYAEFDNDDEDVGEYEDEDIKSSPIYQLDLGEFLTSFIKEQAKNNPTGFSSLASNNLNMNEQQTLEKIIHS
ncbi:hypothetical protein IWQ61_000846 [Dispira simplex]|nr:hypothetical protein IWQ61_000846 [Dispira simplex]